MSKGKIHWCPVGFQPICGAKPEWTKIASCERQITCKNCRRICDEPMVWSENGKILVTQKSYPQGEICPRP